jgi:hypothetical protein
LIDKVLKNDFVEYHFVILDKGKENGKETILLLNKVEDEKYKDFYRIGKKYDNASYSFKKLKGIALLDKMIKLNKVNA